MTNKNVAPRVLASALVLTGCVVLAQVAFAQATTPESGMVESRAHSIGLLGIIMRSGWLGVLTWLGILFWSAASWPLGIVSVIHCGMMKTRQIPLATKLLLLGPVWLLMLAWLGVTQATIYSFFNLATMASGAVQQAFLALNISHGLWSVAFALGGTLHYLFFLTVSMIIIHFKRKKLMASS